MRNTLYLNRKIFKKGVDKPLFLCYNSINERRKEMNTMLPTTTYYLISNGASGMTPAMLIGAVAIGVVLAGALMGLAHWLLNR
jgi:hypothetical protein